MKQYEPMVYAKVLQLLETIVQRGQVDLAEIISYFALVSLYIAQLKPTLTPC